tara:strand:+ start:589 stop:861 length:273 start_codon:yes stop_codon:yes gene_type:complete
MELQDLKALDTETTNESFNKEAVVSFQSEISLPIQLAMNKFIERYPNWDQYRLVQAALSGFLMQHGVNSRSISRLYVGNMFSKNGCSNNY